MVVTSLEKNKHVVDLEELFITIARYKLKLNPEKCVFGCLLYTSDAADE